MCLDNEVATFISNVELSIYELQIIECTCIFVRFYCPRILCRNCFNSLSLFMSSLFLSAVVLLWIVW